MLRLKVTAGPSPGGPVGACGARALARQTRDAITALAPNISMATCSGAVPRAISAADSDCMNASGPHR